MPIMLAMLLSGLLLGAGAGVGQEINLNTPDINALGLPLPPSFGPLMVPEVVGDGVNVWNRGYPVKNGGSLVDPTPDVVIGADQVGFFNPNGVSLTFGVTIGGADRNLTLGARQIVTLDCLPCENAVARIGTDASFAKTGLTVGTLYLLKAVDSKWTVVGVSQAGGQAN